MSRSRHCWGTRPTPWRVLRRTRTTIRPDAEPVGRDGRGDDQQREVPHGQLPVRRPLPSSRVRARGIARRRRCNASPWRAPEPSAPHDGRRFVGACRRGAEACADERPEQERALPHEEVVGEVLDEHARDQREARGANGGGARVCAPATRRNATATETSRKTNAASPTSPVSSARFRKTLCACMRSGS